MPKPTKGAILDLGCGDGRHFPIFNQSNLDAYGVEISEEICLNVSANLSDKKIPHINIVKGMTDDLPLVIIFLIICLHGIAVIT